MALKNGNYFVWHCEWCDSTNYTVWTRMATEGLICGACQRQAGEYGEDSPVFMQAHLSIEAGVYA